MVSKKIRPKVGAPQYPEKQDHNFKQIQKLYGLLKINCWECLVCKMRLGSDVNVCGIWYKQYPQYWGKVAKNFSKSNSDVFNFPTIINELKNITLVYKNLWKYHFIYDKYLLFADHKNQTQVNTQSIFQREISAG